MYKIAAIIGGVLLMAGVALAGTVSSLGSPSSPTIGQTIPSATTTTTGQEDRATEARGRANEAGEDLRGPCDETEHADDPRCTGAGATTAARDDDNDRADNSGPGSEGNVRSISMTQNDGGLRAEARLILSWPVYRHLGIDLGLFLNGAFLGSSPILINLPTNDAEKPNVVCLPEMPWGMIRGVVGLSWGV